MESGDRIGGYIDSRSGSGRERGAATVGAVQKEADGAERRRRRMTGCGKNWVRPLLPFWDMRLLFGTTRRHRSRVIMHGRWIEG